MTNPNESPRSNGSLEQIDDDDRTLCYQNGVLPADFPKRLERLKEASGLTWSGFARAVGADPKQVHRWRNGAEPCGGVMLSIFSFAARIPGGLAILMNEGFQMSFLKEDS